MGWTGYRATEFKNGRIDRKAECEQEISTWWKDGRQSLVKSALKGSVFYGAIRNNQSGEVWAIVMLTRTDGEEFAYKEMSEDMEPFYYDCPKTILDILTPTDNEHSKIWRQKCREKAEKAKNSFLKYSKIGDKIVYTANNGTEYILTKHAPAYQFKTPFWYCEETGQYIPKTHINEDNSRPYIEEVAQEEVEKENETMSRNDEEMVVFEGMKFVDGCGEVFTITNLNSMSIEFNGGTRTIYDFGTKRTIKDILSALGEGSRRLMLYEVEEMEETAQKPQEEPETMEDDTDTTAKEKEPEKATENTQEEKKEMIYKYGMRLRGFSIGCQPAGVVERLDDTTGKYWDIITYNRPLTAEELRTYSLDDLNDNKINRILAEYTAQYERLYNSNNSKLEQSASAQFDVYSKENEDFISEICNAKGDFISSDRESAALMIALVKLGYAKTKRLDTDTKKEDKEPDSTENMLQPSENPACEEIGKNGEVLEENTPEISDSIPEGTGDKNNFAMENQTETIKENDYVIATYTQTTTGERIAISKYNDGYYYITFSYGSNGDCPLHTKFETLEDAEKTVYEFRPHTVKDGEPTKEQDTETTEPPTDNYFIENMETGKIELHFEKSVYMALSEEQKREIKSNFLFSKYSSAWVSRCKFPNTYRAKELAKKLGLADGGKAGETLSFEEQQQIKASKAERRADRMEYRAEKAQERGETLQKPINDMHGDIAFFTQPNINTSAGRAFTLRRDKMWAAWENGFNEFKKSEYYKERAEQARQTAQQTRPTEKGFIQRRIDEAQKTIRAQKKNIKEYEDILQRIENGETVTAWNGKPYNVEKLKEYIEHHNRILEDAMSKAIYYYDCMEELGGLKYSKSNIKRGDIVNVGRWKVKVESTGTKNISGVILHDDLTPWILNQQTGYTMRTKASYAEIKELVTV